MKKGLSVLLIAAALFGFYGSALNLNDILACKDYWEEAGEKSTADMNKLEDGLNQLKENEQAYLDGQEQLAEGEKTLADGEKQYAQGLKDYEAAPGKLKAGEKQLAEGYDSYSDLKKLIAGLNEVRRHGTKVTSSHDTYWHDGFSHKVSDAVIAKMLAGEKTNDSPGLEQARKVITGTLEKSKDDVALIEGLVGASVGVSNIVNSAKTAGSYEKFNKVMKDAYKAFDAAEAQLKAISQMAKTYSATIGGMLDSNLATNTTAVPQEVDGEGQITKTKPFNECNIADLNKGIAILEGFESKLKAGIDTADAGIAQLQGVINQIDQKIKELEDSISPSNPDQEIINTIAGLKNNKANYEQQLEGAKQTKQGLEAQLEEVQNSLGLLKKAVGGRAQAQDMIQGVLDTYGAQFQAAAASNPDLKALVGLMQAIANNVVINPNTGEVVGQDESNQVFYGYMNKLKDGLTQAAALLDSKIPTVQASKKSFNDWMKGYKTLAEGKDGNGNSDLASTSNGIPFAFTSMLTNKTIKSALKTYDKGLIKELKKYTGANKYKLRDEDLDKFDEDLVKISTQIIPRAQKVLAKVKKSAEKQLANGEKQLAQGRADYKAAPGKLADAEKQLADGRQQLADGKAQLAQYEDGEQQVRDGLAQLVGTEPDLDLVGILDRLDGDGDFDNGDDHLDLDEGLNAVEVGRGYQADDGVLITNEIMGRAVGTGALLGAGALAVLAAILSFLKKNKGAGVAAILAAAAGAFGAFYGTNAGTYFSNIAGSTAGNAAWIGAGILGAVALVHAIVHFTAKTDA